MSIITSRLAGIAGALLLSVAARADTLPHSHFAVAGWDGSARGHADGEFTFCTVGHKYPNGVELNLARSREGLFFIALKNPAWSLTKDADASARVVLDRNAGHEEKGTVIASDTVLFTFWPRAGAVYAAMLSSSSELSVAGLSVRPQDATLDFDLAGTRDALDALGRCVKQHGESSVAALPE